MAAGEEDRGRGRPRDMGREPWREHCGHGGALRAVLHKGRQREDTGVDAVPLQAAVRRGGLQQDVRILKLRGIYKDGAGDDALYDMLGSETFQKYVARGTIEVAPLAYMRGRTLNDSFIILDEAQNTTPEQMKMFLTRFGFGSKMVITGDITQIDLPNGKNSGLKQAAYVLQKTPGVGIIRFGEADVVRHEIVAAIIRAYENYDSRRQKQREADNDNNAGK